MTTEQIILLIAAICTELDIQNHKGPQQRLRNYVGQLNNGAKRDVALDQEVKEWAENLGLPPYDTNIKVVAWSSRGCPICGGILPSVVTNWPKGFRSKCPDCKATFVSRK